MTRRRSTAALAAGLAAVALGLTACSDDGEEDPVASVSDDTLVVYNAQHEQLTEEWAEAFTEETGIEVVLRNGNDAELGNQLVQEGEDSRADVFLTENSPAMSLVENAGLLTPVDQATLDQVPEQYRPSSGLWTGIAARSTVFVYNPDELTEAELPASIMDLADPAWKGRWGAAPGGADFQAIVSAILELEGPDATSQWLEAMEENVTVYQNNIATMKAVNAGEVPGGVIYHYYWFRDQDGTQENSGNTELHFFGHQDPGAFVSVSGGGVLASSENQDEAQQFLAFLTGTTGQEILGTGYSMEYPVASGVPANPALPTLESLQAPAVDPSTLNSVEVTDLMTDAGLL
ncbi:iron ABC transporter substrate-binding protein [Jiangella rhizosphaerae]|uniref:Iron ABC transporter substrate-binding protein n=1 Tax=Jiangella rhizosphaerae TaxID=2293569 RepID=A0A418KPR9_9ACTN|nr:iron ABC transporter substrate-binding protein [Jiangella rhizosphaerae]RIQ21629.1 iron ABC transporter substrate-binding protein [Jiangella rhizosphaerae]